MTHIVNVIALAATQETRL